MIIFSSVQFSSVAQLYPTLCDPMDYSTSGLSVHRQLLEFTQTHVHGVSGTIQLSHPLLSPSPPAFNLSQHQGLFQWVSSLHQVAKVLEFQLQHQSFQWIFRTDFLHWKEWVNSLHEVAKILIFSFSIIPSNEHPRLISFRMDWLDLLAVQGTLKSLLQHHSSKASILQCSAFFIVQL